jgi:condensin complex subunit 2
MGKGKESSRRRTSMFISARPTGPLTLIQDPPTTTADPNEPLMSQAELHQNYEAWMRIAADNKINTNNSWSVQLIDYFHELSLMRDEDGGEINFQKASCTLDGCVKVYTTRVDAVASETNRLLTGLSDNNTSTLSTLTCIVSTDF